MTLLKRKRISSEIEKKIIIGMVVSDIFCREIKHMYQEEYFLNDYLRRISSWCMDYFSQYGKAPSRHIQDIYEVEKESLKPAESELIESLLSGLSEEY